MAVQGRRDVLIVVVRSSPSTSTQRSHASNAATDAELAAFRENRRTFEPLRASLEAALRSGAVGELYDAAEFWLEPLERVNLRAEDLTRERFVFDERRHCTPLDP